MKRAAIILIVIVVVAGLGIFAWTKRSSAAAADKTQYKIAKVEVGMVKKTVSATGTLQAWSTVDIKSKAGGKVLQMRTEKRDENGNVVRGKDGRVIMEDVEVGTKVYPGASIALIDPADTQLSVNQAQADIDSADAKITQSSVTLDMQKQQSDLGVATAETGVASARAAYEAARARLASARQQSTAQPILTKASIASAQANYDSAVKQLAQIREATNPQETAGAQSAFDQAEANRIQAQSNLARQQRLLDKGFVSQQVVDDARASFEVMKAQVANARRKLDTLSQEQDAIVKAQEARVQQAKAQLDNANAGSVDVDVRKSAVVEADAGVTQAWRAVQAAEKNLALSKAQMKNVPIRQADILTAVATRKRAGASLTNAKLTLDQTKVTAPTAGVILQKYVEPGTIISSALSFAATGNNIVQIGDVTRMYVDVTVDETDIANVDMGQPVDVTIEAYPSLSFEGKVTRINPAAVVESNVTNIHVRVEIDNSVASFRLLKPGMNSTCEFVKDKKENVVEVPTEAVHTDDKGDHYVEIAKGGKPAPVDPKSGGSPDPSTLIDVALIKRPVTIGTEGNDSDEITAGLKEGDTIVTQKIEPVVQQAGSAMGGGMGGFGGRGGGGRR